MATYLVTGASRGIGYALADALIARGDRVIAAVRDPFRVPDLLKRAPRENAAIIGLDVSDPRSIERAAASVTEPIDVLINNAGVMGPERQTVLDMDFDGFMRAIAVNVFGPLRVTKAFLPQLRQASTPKVMTISSQMGSLGSVSAHKSNHMAYRSSKTMLNKMMQGLTTDLRPLGVAVLTVHPGWVRTDMGGGGADIAPETSARDLLKLLEALDLAGTGRFLNHDGATIPW
jgi:NAD(P)-dependent dehydrogenase (short-subunit alcohol dehydrogenase family)